MGVYSHHELLVVNAKDRLTVLDASALCGIGLRDLAATNLRVTLSESCGNFCGVHPTGRSQPG